jgi:hypothetical protein
MTKRREFHLVEEKILTPCPQHVTSGHLRAIDGRRHSAPELRREANSAPRSPTVQPGATRNSIRGNFHAKQRTYPAHRNDAIRLDVAGCHDRRG